MKYNKQQLEAIDGLKIFLDELDTKPRRFFDALKGFALEFNTDALQGIKNAEDAYYHYLREGEKIAMLFDTLIEFKGMYPGLDDNIKGAEDFMKLYIKNYLNL